MLAEKELKKIVRGLVHDCYVKVEFQGVDLIFNTLDRTTHKGSISACVYFGNNFIPQSVRNSLSQTPFKTSLSTFFSIDEEHFNIYLYYVGEVNVEHDQLNHLLEEFCWAVQEWRLYLDEQDKNDLVYVHVK